MIPRGLDQHTGALLDADAHVAQSIVDILSTARGTRVMRRDYGSDLPRLIDAPINGETVVDLYAATAEALDRWEPRYRLRRVELGVASAGRVSLTLTGELRQPGTSPRDDTRVIDLWSRR